MSKLRDPYDTFEIGMRKLKATHEKNKGICSSKDMAKYEKQYREDTLKRVYEKNERDKVKKNTVD
jgi:hypothetical protein